MASYDRSRKRPLEQTDDFGVIANVHLAITKDRDRPEVDLPYRPYIGEMQMQWQVWKGPALIIDKEGITCLILQDFEGSTVKLSKWLHLFDDTLHVLGDLFTYRQCFARRIRDPRQVRLSPF